MAKRKYNPSQVVGDWGEIKLMLMFDLVRTDPDMRGALPDLIAKDGSYCVESKASRFDNGGVINEKQLYRFDELTNIRRFYSFTFHLAKKPMKKHYQTDKRLIAALDKHFLATYLFPFSITKAHFETGNYIATPNHHNYVQMRGRTADQIFLENEEEWARINLNINNYCFRELVPDKVFLVTREGYLEDKIYESFNPESL